MSMMMIIIIKLENDSVIEKSLEELNGIKIDNDYDQDDKMMMVFWVNATTKKKKKITLKIHLQNIQKKKKKN